jgi:hypothetical protein
LNRLALKKLEKFLQPFFKKKSICKIFSAKIFLGVLSPLTRQEKSFLIDSDYDRPLPASCPGVTAAKIPGMILKLFGLREYNELINSLKLAFKQIKNKIKNGNYGQKIFRHRWCMRIYIP